MSTEPDLAESINLLDAHATDDNRRVIEILRNDVASVLAVSFTRSLYGNGVNFRGSVTRQHVAAALSAHGATFLTIKLHAAPIAKRIRHDYTDGGLHG
jgi:hypothetical protein